MEFYVSKVAGDHDRGVQSIDYRFSEVTAPALAQKPGFAHYTAYRQPRYVILPGNSLPTIFRCLQTGKP